MYVSSRNEKVYNGWWLFRAANRFFVWLWEWFFGLHGVLVLVCMLCAVIYILFLLC